MRSNGIKTIYSFQSSTNLSVCGFVHQFLRGYVISTRNWSIFRSIVARLLLHLAVVAIITAIIVINYGFPAIYFKLNPFKELNPFCIWISDVFIWRMFLIYSYVLYSECQKVSVTFYSYCFKSEARIFYVEFAMGKGMTNTV